MSIRPAQSWSAHLWELIEPTYVSILKHPFLTGLADGTLEHQAFARYVAQDVHYLREYARCLAVVGAKAWSSADTAMFDRHSAGAVEAELVLHETLLAALGPDNPTVTAEPATPTTQAYTSYLLATAYGGSFAEGLAAVLPCYWIYAQVGVALQAQGSPDPQYQQWIDAYAGEEFGVLVQQVLDLVDRVGPSLGEPERQRAQHHLQVTARYEWMFWDSAYRDERWPL
jgi:thiaminase (transcriptional activator TenA)